MHIDKYKQDDGWYKDGDGCVYETAEDFYQCGVFGFCGCGDPEVNLQYIMKGLRHIADLKDHVWGTGRIVFDEEHGDMTYGEWEIQGVELFKTDAQMWFFMYWADKEELTDHGGNVSGGWLTEKGLDVLEDLEELFNKP